MNAIVVGDLHLTRHSPPPVAADFSALLEANAGKQVVVAGDLFDLSTDAPKDEHALDTIIGSQPCLRRSIAQFLERGGHLMVISGNHDAAVTSDSLAQALDLDGSERQRLACSPWFVRYGKLHVEHGHLYDPDNAPAHPLVVGAPSLGVHFSAEFVHPTGAHRYLQNNDGTPLDLLLSAFRWYGRRAPYVIYRYFHAAFGALAQSGPWHRIENERKLGEERRGRFAEDAGVPPSVIDAVLAARAGSTLESWSQTFARLYMDRVMATLLTGTGIGAVALGARASGVTLTTLGAMLMASSWLRGHDRYGGTVVEHLNRAADRIIDTADASFVVFGHTHREALTDRYANTGSFAFPRDAPGRPFLRVADDTQLARCYWR